MTAAQAPAYDAVDPRFRSCVVADALLEPLVEGARWLEGPVWFADHRVLWASDIPNDRILRVTEAGEASVVRGITRTELDGQVTMLVDRHRGKRLNAPNDVVVKRDGTIWFTDPVYGIQTDHEGEKQVSELPAAVLLGRVVLPFAVSSLYFGGRLNSRLFPCAGPAPYALTVNRRRAAAP